MKVTFRGHVLVLLSLCFSATLSYGRVFESIGRSGQGRYENLAGWTRAYASTWTINGGKTQIEVWNASEPIDRTIERLKADAVKQGDIAAFFPGSSMAWGVSAGGGRVTRFICNGMESGRQTLVFRFSQTEADFRRSLEGIQDATLPEDIPPVPGSRPVFVAAGSEGTTLAIFTYQGGEADARDFLAQSLEHAGWVPSLGPGASAADGMGLYLRGSSLCGFSAKMSRHDGSCTVTVLHRRLNRGD